MVKLFAFDLDGTLYLGGEAVRGAVDTINYLKGKCKVVFFTNNSSKTKLEIVEKLNRLGFECDYDDVYTSSSSTALFLKESGMDDLYVVGTDGFCEELKKHGLKLVNSDAAKNLVVGLDFDFNYKKIAIALSILKRGGKFIACNEDANFPVEGGKVMPACGAMVGAIRASSGKVPDAIVGKPSTYILSWIADKNNVQCHEIVVVGDSYESDIMMAKNFNSKSVLINVETSAMTFYDKDLLVVGDHFDLLGCLKKSTLDQTNSISGKMFDARR